MMNKGPKTGIKVGSTIRCKLPDGVVADGQVTHIGASSRGDQGESYSMLTINVQHPLTQVTQTVYTAVNVNEIVW